MTVGGGARSSARVFTSSDWSSDTVRGDTELMRDAYTGEFVEFAVAIRECRKPSATGFDARRALAVALACIESVHTHDPAARALASQLLAVVHRPDGIISIDPMARALRIWPGPQRARSGAHRRLDHY